MNGLAGAGALASEAQLAAVGLAACRVAGVCLFAPVLASRVVPRRVALAFAVALAVAALPGLLAVPPVASAGAFAAGAIAEVMTGAVLGLMALLPLAAFRVSGALMGVQMGMGFGTLYDGGEGAQVAAGGDGLEYSPGDGVEQLLTIGAVAMFVWAGGLESLAVGVLRSFDYLPLAQWPEWSALPALLGRALLACSELTLRVAMPVTVVLVAEALVTGLILRAVPTLGPVQFGFPLRVGVGLLALAAGALAMQDVMTGATGEMLGQMHAWVTAGAEVPAGGLP